MLYNYVLIQDTIEINAPLISNHCKINYILVVFTNCCRAISLSLKSWEIIVKILPNLLNESNCMSSNYENFCIVSFERNETTLIIRQFQATNSWYLPSWFILSHLTFENYIEINKFIYSNYLIFFRRNSRTY